MCVCPSQNKAQLLHSAKAHPHPPLEPKPSTLFPAFALEVSSFPSTFMHSNPPQPRKHQRQEIWIQVPALPQTPWPWPTPAPSTSVFICMMLCGVVTRPLLPLPWLTASTWPPGLPSILSSRPMAGPLGRTGEHGGGQRILCFVF